MERYLFIARSVTHAQRMERILTNSGIRCRIYRAPLELSGQGCSYAVEIAESNLPMALKMIRGANLGPISLYSITKNGYREAIL